MSFPGCVNCGQPFDAHEPLPSGERACPGGGGTFDVVFQPSPEVIDFVRENLDKSPEELAELWIDRVLKRNQRDPKGNDRP